jgi:hypothetical protein
MPGSVRGSAARRGHLLSRTRVLSARIGGAAAATALGLGVAFAHAAPGHVRSVVAQSTHARPGPGPAAQRPAEAGRRHGRHSRHLAPPPQQPSSTPSAPQVSSGGS